MGDDNNKVKLTIDGREVTPEHEIKSVGQEETFDADVTDKLKLHKEILYLANKVGWRLRKYGLTGRTVTLKIKYSDFKQITRSTTLQSATDDGHLLYQEALKLLGKTDIGVIPVRLAGVTVSNFCDPDKNEQMNLFAPPATKYKRQRVNRAVDNISDKYGAKAIQPATLIGNLPPEPDE